MQYVIPHLPLKNDVETKILINTLVLQEAKDSSAVENIITTHDEIYKAELNIAKFQTVAVKEVQRYASALKLGYEDLNARKVINHASIKKIQGILEQNDAGYRQVPGTKLENDLTKEVVYVPPQLHTEIVQHMDVLLAYINDDQLDDTDPLVKMAIILHQFESIHPFYDGNGRTGRMLNILYLILKDILDIPTLYLSRYITKNKADYYRLLQSVRDNNTWEDWILFILKGCEEIATESITLIKEIKNLMQQMKHHIRDNYKFYSQDLLNNLFRHPYTKIEFLENELQVERRTTAKYLNILVNDKQLNITKLKMGNSNYYMNNSLINLLINHRSIINSVL